MKQGINLASRPIRTGGIMRAVGAGVAVLGLLSTGVHLTGWLEFRSEVIDLQDDVDRMEGRLDFLNRRTTDVRRELARAPSPDVIQWLIAWEVSGVTDAVRPTEILRATAEALPSDARILSFKINSGRQVELNIEALVGSPRAAADFVSALNESSYVLETEIVDEKHRGDGDIMLQLIASLQAPRTH